MIEPPAYGETVYFGDQPRIVVHVEGTYVVSVPADTAFRGTHQGNLQNEKGEYQWQL